MARVTPAQSRPGVIHRIDSVPRVSITIPTTGRAMVMLPTDWYEPNTTVRITAAEWFSGITALRHLGMTASPEFSEWNRGMNLLMEGAGSALIYPQRIGGTKSTAELGDITVTARKYGNMGNRLSVAISSQPNGHAVDTFFGSARVHRQTVATPAELQDNHFVEFSSPDGAVFSIVEMQALSGGESGTIPSYANQLPNFLYAASLEDWDVIGLSIAPDDAGYSDAVSTFSAWLTAFNEEISRWKRGVLFNNAEISTDNYLVTNLKMTQEIDGRRATPAEMVLWETGFAAGTQANRAQAGRNGARRGRNVLPRMNKQEQEDALNHGFFIYDEDRDGANRVLSDVNSFTSTSINRNIQFTSNRTIRAGDLWKETVERIFRNDFLGVVDDTDEGRALFRISLHTAAIALENANVIAGHDIEKIEVRPHSFRHWETVYSDMIIPDAVMTVNVHTTITWGGTE